MCKGSWIFAKQKDWGIVTSYFFTITSYFTHPLRQKSKIFASPYTGDVIKLRNLCHSEAAQQPWESVPPESNTDCHIPIAFAQGPRNDILNLMTLPYTGESFFSRNIRAIFLVKFSLTNDPFPCIIVSVSRG